MQGEPHYRASRAPPTGEGEICSCPRRLEEGLSVGMLRSGSHSLSTSGTQPFQSWGKVESHARATAPANGPQVPRLGGMPLQEFCHGSFAR